MGWTGFGGNERMFLRKDKGWMKWWWDKGEVNGGVCWFGVY